MAISDPLAKPDIISSRTAAIMQKTMPIVIGWNVMEMALNTVILS